MAGMVTSSGFQGKFKGLNGTTTLTATHTDFIRSLLTVGYPSRRAAVRLVGPWRARMLIAMAKGYLGPSLQTTNYFRNLEQSEKVGVSFLFGEAFTHWYAQERMKIEYLVHVAGLKSCMWASSATPIVPKKGATLPAPKSRPDFIGIRRSERHVFESKGRVRRPSGSAVSKALGQVSALQTINGKKPKTRCASFFMLKALGAEGLVYDPPSKGIAVDVSFDEYDAISKAYAFFLDQSEDALSVGFINDFVGLEIDDGIFLGADKKVLDTLRERPTDARRRNQRAREVLQLVENRGEYYQGLREANVSAGIDGIVLVDKNAPQKKRQRFRT